MKYDQPVHTQLAEDTVESVFRNEDIENIDNMVEDDFGEEVLPEDLHQILQAFDLEADFSELEASSLLLTEDPNSDENNFDRIETLSVVDNQFISERLFNAFSDLTVVDKSLEQPQNFTENHETDEDAPKEEEITETFPDEIEDFEVTVPIPDDGSNQDDNQN